MLTKIKNNICSFFEPDINSKRIELTHDLIKHKEYKSAILNESCAIGLIENPTPEIYMFAMRNNGFSLRNIDPNKPGMTPELLRELSLEAVKQNGLALAYVINQTPEICLEAIKQNTLAFQYVKEQTPELCLEAIKQNAYATFRFVKNKTPELCLEAVKQNGFCLKFIDNQTPELCSEAVKQNGLALMYVKPEFRNLFNNV